MIISVSVTPTLNVFNLMVITFSRTIGYLIFIIIKNVRHPVIKGFAESFQFWNIIFCNQAFVVFQECNCIFLFFKLEEFSEFFLKVMQFLNFRILCTRKNKL